MESNNRRRRANPPKGPRRRVAAPQRQLIPHPPQIQSYGITHATRLRFVAAAAATTSITFQNLLDTINFALTAITAAPVFDRVKIRRVLAWAVPVIGNASTVQVEFAGATVGQSGDAVIHTDTSMGIEPAHVSAVPSARCQAAQFQPGNAVSAMILTVPAGAVVDVELTFRGLPNTPLATQNAPAAASPGAWYYRGLDGLAAAATNFVPVINGSGVD